MCGQIRSSYVRAIADVDTGEFEPERMVKFKTSFGGMAASCRHAATLCCYAASMPPLFREDRQLLG